MWCCIDTLEPFSVRPGSTVYFATVTEYHRLGNDRRREKSYFSSLFWRLGYSKAHWQHLARTWVLQCCMEDFTRGQVTMCKKASLRRMDILLSEQTHSSNPLMEAAPAGKSHFSTRLHWELMFQHMEFQTIAEEKVLRNQLNFCCVEPLPSATSGYSAFEMWLLQEKMFSKRRRDTRSTRICLRKTMWNISLILFVLITC